MPLAYLRCDLHPWLSWRGAQQAADGYAPSGAPRHSPVLQLQREDLAALGNLLLLLACVGRGVPPSLDYLTAHFSRELCHVVAGLLAASEGAPAWGHCGLLDYCPHPCWTCWSDAKQFPY